MGHGANMTINNFSPYLIKVEVVRKHCIFPQTADNPPSGIDVFNVALAPSGGTKRGYIENKASSSGGDLCATDTGYFELSFTVMRDELPDPRFVPSMLVVAIKSKHFEEGDGHRDGAVKVDLAVTEGDQDQITIDIKENG